MDKFVSGETTFKYNPMTSEEVSVTVNNMTNTVNSIEDKLNNIESYTTNSIRVLYDTVNNNYGVLNTLINEKEYELTSKIVEERNLLNVNIAHINDKMSNMYQFLSWFFLPLLHLLISPIGQIWNYITGTYLVNVDVIILNITDDGEPIRRKFLVRQMIFLDKTIYSRKKRLQKVRENHSKWKKEWKSLKKENMDSNSIIKMASKSIIQII